jgi:hypothetical protein
VFWGGQAALSERCRQVARHAEKRKAHKGVLTIVSVPAEAGEAAAVEEPSGQQVRQASTGVGKTVREQGQPMDVDRQQGKAKRSKRRRR